MNRFFHNILSAVAAVAAMALGGAATSCTMIEDDVTDCPTGLYVRFVYDYNTQRADMFRDHVGHVKLYVYDEQGHKVAERSVSNAADFTPLRNYGYTIHFNPAELAPGRYRLQAVAMHKDWDEALAAPGAKYRREESPEATDLKIHLDHAASPVEGTDLYPVEHGPDGLDILWHTLKVMSYTPDDGRDVPPMHTTARPYSVYPLEDQLVTVTDNMATYATVSMVRDTKHLDLTLRQIDDPDNMFHQDYAVEIVDANGSLGHDNEVLDGPTLFYTPYESWTTRFDENGVQPDQGRPESKAAVLQRTAHYNVMFNRLAIDPANASKGAMLRITHRESGKTVAEMNLTHLLSEGRTAYELANYAPQEYLDREYDYHLDFLLKGDQWAYCDIRINLLSWSKRIENISL